MPFFTPGDLPDPGTETTSPASPALAGGFFTTRPPGKPPVMMNSEFVLFGESWSPLEPSALHPLEIPSRSYRHYADLQVLRSLPGELRTLLPCRRHPQSEGAGTPSSILFSPITLLLFHARCTQTMGALEEQTV